MKKQIMLKFIFFILGVLIGCWWLKLDIFQAYNVGQSLFDEVYIWPC